MSDESPSQTWVGLGVTGDIDALWSFTCPCGVTASYGLNKLPTETLKHPCNHPDHWSTRYWDPAASKGQS